MVKGANDRANDPRWPVSQLVETFLIESITEMEKSREEVAGARIGETGVMATDVGAQLEAALPESTLLAGAGQGAGGTNPVIC